MLALLEEEVFVVGCSGLTEELCATGGTPDRCSDVDPMAMTHFRAQCMMPMRWKGGSINAWHRRVLTTFVAWLPRGSDDAAAAAVPCPPPPLFVEALDALAPGAPLKGCMKLNKVAYPASTGGGRRPRGVPSLFRSLLFVHHMYSNDQYPPSVVEDGSMGDAVSMKYVARFWTETWKAVTEGVGWDWELPRSKVGELEERPLLEALVAALASRRYVRWNVSSRVLLTSGLYVDSRTPYGNATAAA